MAILSFMPSPAAAKRYNTRVVPAASADEVMVEQLEFLIEHAQGGDCGCDTCERYGLARELLLEAFRDETIPVRFSSRAGR